MGWFEGSSKDSETRSKNQRVETGKTEEILWKVESHIKYRKDDLVKNNHSEMGKLKEIFSGQFEELEKN